MNRRHRLLGRSAFAAVRARRAGASGGFLRVSAAPNDLGRPRVGFVVPRGVGGAVVRNRIRRRLRPLIAAHLERLGGLDLVVGAGPGAERVAPAALAAELERCLRSAAERAAP